ncbi:HD-GYP domain-containing protein [Hippea maritima]|uniref:Metal dependent phosphohydrolase n=1 Tax=Hippea maritima (strain ATCC 700847 / DSM 10411 / MH2) TaxID=760142 RepID=F2LUE3_HIPMA|nr:HD domain-containing phosphohydrolase [Hippea maritima]AEA33469.1 metal dependent phosphohydrolase [Hippea maritima DSM 10411]
MKFTPIRLKLIKPSQKRDFDIYILEETKPVLLLSKDKPFDKDNPALKYNSNFIAYIPISQLKEYKKYICKNIDDILKDPLMSKKNKMYAIYISLIDNLENLVNNRDLNIARDISKNISLFIANAINDEKAMAIFLSFIKSDVHNLAVHMFNVGIYASMLTKKMFTDLSTQKLEEISKGYFLHDIGMLKIDPEILLKKGKYSKEEYEEIKKHTIYGVEIIRNDLKIRSPIIERIILEHHERKDGSGYPYGKTDINIFAKICSICDIFDAITSKREYKDENPKTTFEALKDNIDFFVSEFGKDIYENFVKCFSVVI